MVLEAFLCPFNYRPCYHLNNNSVRLYVYIYVFEQAEAYSIKQLSYCHREQATRLIFTYIVYLPMHHRHTPISGTM